MKQRSSYDRRCGEDRRIKSETDYLQKTITDRRKNKNDRRISDERRLAWIRGIKWRSIWIETLR